MDNIILSMEQLKDRHRFNVISELAVPKNAERAFFFTGDVDKALKLVDASFMLTRVEYPQTPAEFIEKFRQGFRRLDTIEELKNYMNTKNMNT